MVNQSDYVNHLKKRMYYSIEQRFYLESISCSYAIVENRTKRIVEHLGKSASGMRLDKKMEYIYESIKNKQNESDPKMKKLIGYLEYRISPELMQIDPLKDYNNWKRDLNHSVNSNSGNKLYHFKQLRNKLIHELATYDSGNPALINFDSYSDLAELGKEVADGLLKIAIRMKAKKRKLNL